MPGSGLRISDMKNNQLEQSPSSANEGWVKILDPEATTVRVEIISAQTIPQDFSLMQNYPNPFNPSTKISFFVGTYGHTSLRVYDILGREIRTLVNQVETPGYHTVEWDGRSSAGQKVGSGIYFYRLSVVPTAQRDLVPTKSRNGKTESGFTKTQKMLMLK
jgi:hypothetical protein